MAVSQKQREVQSLFSKLKVLKRDFDQVIAKREEIKELEVEKCQKQKTIELLKQKKDDLQRRIPQEREIPPKLKESKRSCLQHVYRTEGLQEVYDKVILKLGRALRRDLQALLSCKAQSVTESTDTREAYRFYGLLLSACCLKKTEASSEVMTKVFTLLPTSYQSKKDIMIHHVSKAVELTHNMLTLLPPLVVCRPPQYSDALQDTNRRTWDERKSDDSLIYYRPVLVYGNQLHVAIKGLVGNSEIEITDEPSTESDTTSQIQKLTTELPPQAAESTYGQSSPDHGAGLVKVESQDKLHQHRSNYDHHQPAYGQPQGIQHQHNESPQHGYQGHQSHTQVASHPHAIDPYTWQPGQTLKYCWVCRHAAQQKDAHLFTGGEVIHKECFICRKSGCGKQLSINDPTVIYFHGQLYCHTHKGHIKCPHCSCHIPQRYCGHCQRSWQ